MLRKVATLSCMALAVATFSGANPAGAKPSATVHVSVAAQWEPIATLFLCSDYGFNYRQRITIDGDSMMAPVASVAPPGHYEAILWDTCDGYDIYAFDSCLCQLVAVESST